MGDHLLGDRRVVERGIPGRTRLWLRLP
jgi:hypothetical protein